jgi:hypothetical protein
MYERRFGELAGYGDLAQLLAGGYTQIQLRSVHDSSDEQVQLLEDRMKAGVENDPVYFLVDRSSGLPMIIEGRHRVLIKLKLLKDHDTMTADGMTPPYNRNTLISLVKLHSDTPLEVCTAFAQRTSCSSARVLLSACLSGSSLTLCGSHL